MSVFDIEGYSKALKNFLKAMKALREQKILINKKDFTCQIGEWLVEMIYEGQRSSNGIQKGWDILAKNEYFQVKAHAKSATNKARFTGVNKIYEEKVDYLIIIVFTSDYKLKEFYKVPWEKALENMKLRGRKNPRSEITWSSIANYKADIATLPHQEIIRLFS